MRVRHRDLGLEVKIWHNIEGYGPPVDTNPANAIPEVVPGFPYPFGYGVVECDRRLHTYRAEAVKFVQLTHSLQTPILTQFDQRRSPIGLTRRDGANGMSHGRHRRIQHVIPESHQEYAVETQCFAESKIQ